MTQAKRDALAAKAIRESNYAKRARPIVLRSGRAEQTSAWPVKYAEIRALFTLNTNVMIRLLCSACCAC